MNIKSIISSRLYFVRVRLDYTRILLDFGYHLLPNTKYSVTLTKWRFYLEKCRHTLQHIISVYIYQFIIGFRAATKKNYYRAFKYILLRKIYDDL